MPMSLSFHGADRSVTGSCHLLEAGGCSILVDCGMIQGGDMADENAGDFGFDPRSIDLLLLTHAHLDHCGRLPLLAKRGFRGEVVTTAASRDLARLVLLDAARLQDEEAKRHGRHSGRHADASRPGPLYSLRDTLDSLERFGRAAGYGLPLDLAPGLSATFLDAGHILGSASILVEAAADGRKRRVVFSGDIGNAERPVLGPPSPPAAADIVVMESTYGDRRHRPFPESVKELHTAITTTFARGGNVLIPVFALERAQEMLYVLRQGIDHGRLPAAMTVFLDSPMAVNVTDLFKQHAACCSPDFGRLLAQGIDPFGFPGLHFSREPAESIAINQISGGAVIMAGPGMCTGGRICHHLRHNLWRPEASVVFVGYAAEGTLARRIIDGADKVEVFGEEIPVRARIHTINGFSAHADQAELIEWQNRIAEKQATFLVHGERPAMDALAPHLVGRVEMPTAHSVYTL